MYDVLNNLEVIDMKLVCLHEAHETARLSVTCDAILGEGVLRNPPLAYRMQDGRYLILDGAHRTSALQRIGCKRMVVQRVDTAQCEVNAWDHVVPMGDWLEELRGHEGLCFDLQPRVEPYVARMVEADGTEHFVYAAVDRADARLRHEAWHRIVAAYSGSMPVKRVGHGQIDIPSPDEVLLSYQVTDLDELERIVGEGHVMPAGVTRCMIEGRLLNLRIPLQILLQENLQQEEWDKLRCVWQNSLRMYTETVFVCEAN